MPSHDHDDDDQEDGSSSSSCALDRILAVSREHLLLYQPGPTVVSPKNNNSRAFCLMVHAEHGALLLKCDRKKHKPPHYQLPGGKIDPDDDNDAKKGCAREVFEETGVDFRHRLEELFPMVLYSNEFTTTTTTTTTNDDENAPAVNEYKHRFFYVCRVRDNDFRSDNRNHHPVPILSEEHSGFSFRKDPLEITKTLCWHSGGKVQRALEMAFSVVRDV